MHDCIIFPPNDLLSFELTWYSTDVRLHGALHCCVEALQSLLQHVRLDVCDIGGVGCYLHVRGSHVQLHGQPIKITEHECVQRRHRDAVQKHLQVLRKRRGVILFCLFEPVTRGIDKVSAVWMYSRRLRRVWQQPLTRGLCLYGRGRRGHLCCSMDVWSSVHPRSSCQNYLFTHAQRSVMSTSKNCM